MIHEALAALEAELDRAGARPGDHVLFGSVVMWLRGKRETIGDIDLFVRPHIWEALKPRALLRRPHEDDPPFLEILTEPKLHVFYAWTARDSWLTAEQCFEQAEYVLPTPSGVRPWRCIPLELLAQHKRLAYADYPDGQHEKHLRDLEALGVV